MEGEHVAGASRALEALEDLVELAVAILLCSGHIIARRTGNGCRLSVWKISNLILGDQALSRVFYELCRSDSCAVSAAHHVRNALLRIARRGEGGGAVARAVLAARERGYSVRWAWEACREIVEEWSGEDAAKKRSVQASQSVESVTRPPPSCSP